MQGLPAGFAVFGGVHLIAGAYQHFGAGFANGDVVIDKKNTIGWIRLALNRRAGGFVARSFKERVHSLENFVAALLKTLPSTVVPETLQRRTDGEPYNPRSPGSLQASQEFAVRSTNFSAFLF